jgi:hypothetical protein
VSFPTTMQFRLSILGTHIDHEGYIFPMYVSPSLDLIFMVYWLSNLHVIFINNACRSVSPLPYNLGSPYLVHTLIIMIWSTHWLSWFGPHIDYCDLAHTLIIVIWPTHWLSWIGPHIDYLIWSTHWLLWFDPHIDYHDLVHTLIIVILATHWLLWFGPHIEFIVIWATHWLLWFGPHIDYHDYGGHMCIYYLT